MTQRNPAAGHTPDARPARLQAETLEARDTPAVVGDIDPTFGGGAVSLEGHLFNGVAVLADGKVLTVGTDGADFVLARYNANGTLDTTFDADGVRTLDVGGTADKATALAVQADGKIVVVGSDGADVVVARLNADGSTDTSFDTDGRQTIDFGGAADVANAVAIQSNGRILVAGSDGADFVVARLNPADGSLDTTFNEPVDETEDESEETGDELEETGDRPGVKLIDFGGDADVANAIAVQADGKIVVAGTTGVDFAFTRLNEDGTVDEDFDGNGLAVFDAGGGADAIRSLAIQQDGKIVAVGNNGADFVAMRLHAADGSLDNSFDADGSKKIDVAGVDEARAVVLQSEGKIVITGSTGDHNAAIVRLTSEGTLDTTFGGGDGMAMFDLGGNAIATAVGLTSNERIVIAGQLTTDEGNEGVVMRLAGGVAGEQSRRLVVGGRIDGTAQVYTGVPDSPQFSTSPTSLSAFGGFLGNVRTATGDVDGDGIEDTLLITGPGTQLRFAVISGVDNATLLVAPSIPFAGSESFTGGGYISAGDLDGDGRDEIVVTPDQGGGARVSVFSLSPQGLRLRANFFGITGDSNFRGGARTAVGDVNGDGVKDLAVAAGYGGGPRVAVFDGEELFSTQEKLVNDFYAFPGTDASRLRNGAFIAAGDLDGDGHDDLIFGGGPGGAPRVYALSGERIMNGDMEAAYGYPLANFFVAGNSTDRGGARVAVVDLDGDNRADLAVGSGEQRPGRVRIYAGASFNGGGEPALAQVIDPFGSDIEIKNGVFVG